MAKVGRPTDYTEELTDLICSRISMGESLRSVLRDDGMPSAETVYRWLRLYKVFRDQYARSKEDSADAHEDMIIDISDNPAGQPVLDADGHPVMDADGNPVLVLDNVAIQHAKLRVDSRKWAASKLKPKKYGDAVLQKHADADGEKLPDAYPKCSTAAEFLALVHGKSTD